ncbi:MAG: sirohydrochlorin chelatase [Solibacillus sp.]
MQAVLYVAHGTRVQQGIEEAREFIERIKKQVAIDIQELAFLELAQPTILEGIAKCVWRGATRIAVVPILLLSAQHAKEDIPQLLAQAREQYPHITITVGEPFGIHQKLIDTLYQRIIDQQLEIEAEAEVLLIGRGSSDPDVPRDMKLIAEQLQEQYHFERVSPCFLYGASPSFDEVTEQLQKRQVKQLFIVPYLLFTGLLRNGIQRKIQSLDASRIILCDSLGYDDSVGQVLMERIEEAIR